MTAPDPLADPAVDAAAVRIATWLRVMVDSEFDAADQPVRLLAWAVTRAVRQVDAGEPVDDTITAEIERGPDPG